MKTLKSIAIAAICVAAALPSWAGAARYAQPVWSIGNFNPEDPQGSLIAVTASPRLAFKGLTLVQVKAKLDDGYELSAQMFGGHLNGKGTIVSLYNIRYYPSAGPIEKIFGNFCIVDGGLPKAVCVEFTDGEDGVYVTALKALYALNGAVTTDFMNVAADGTVTYKNYKQLMNLATSWTATSYGAGNLHLAKFVPSASPILVWPGVTIDEIKDYSVSGSMGGSSNPNGYVCNEYNRRAVTNETTGAVTEMTVELQAIHVGYNKCVVVRLTDGEDGVCAQAVAARYVADEPLGFLFSNGDGTYNGTGVSIATGYGQTDYGVYGLAATKKAIYAVSHDIVPKTATLVWPGVTLDDVTNCWFGCRFTGSAIYPSNRGFEGRGCNPRITRDAHGSATKIRVEYQVYDNDNTYIKCVLVDLENGVDGVYATKVGTGFLNTTTEKVGRYFGDVTGTTAYEVYDLSAVPCVTLGTDEDWSPYGRMALGDVVVDLNGHSLTAGELSFDTSRTGMVVNSATSTTAQLRAYVFEGGVISNDSVNVGNKCISTENIKFVKEGKGVYYAAKPLEYVGGTEVSDGVLKAVKSVANGADPVLGAYAGTIKVETGATLDWNGNCNFCDYDFVLAGGTLQNSGVTDMGTKLAIIKGIALTGNSRLSAVRSWGLINFYYAEVAMALGDNALDVSIDSGKTMYFTNVRATGGGKINLSGAGVFQVRDDSNGIGFIGPQVDLRVACELCLIGPMTVHDYEAATSGNGTDLGSQALNVHGTFKPVTRYFRGCTMQDGSTMDFSEWPGSFPVVTDYTCAGEKLVKFATPDAGEVTTVAVKLGGQKVSVNTPIVVWNDDNRPDFSKVKFVRGDSDRKYMLVAKDDGLYVSQGFMVIVR